MADYKGRFGAGQIKPPKGVQPLAQQAGVRKQPGGTPMRSTKISDKITPADRTALPILKNPVMEQKLVEYILERLRLANIERTSRIQRCTDIDIQMSGFIKLDIDDRKREADNKRGKPPKPVKHNLPLTMAQIDEAVTYLMSVFAPNMDIFVATSRADKQAIAEGLMEEVNGQGQLGQYYREMCKMCLNALKYNIGGFSIAWEKHMGYTFENMGGGQVQKKVGVVWEGNTIKSLDMYNFLFDTSVHPVDLPQKGEFFAEIIPITPFRAKKMGEDGKLFGIGRFVNETMPLSPNDGANQISFYYNPPSVRENVGNADGGVTNWRQILSAAGGAGNAQSSRPVLEIAYYTTWIYPNDFGLSDSKVCELWRIAMVNGRYIGFAVKLDDTHGMLPCAMAAPIEDDLINEQRTYAEQLLPLQHFASFLLNTHQDATRKAIYGITLYNPNIFPGLDKSPDEMVGGMIPMRSSATDIDISKAFQQINDAPDTDQNVDMVSKIMEIMQKILPTNQAQQVASLERATEYQAAATVQASNRRNLKIARMISDQALTVLKFQMMYNIYSNIGQIEYTDPQTGQTQTISPADLIDAKIELDVGTGLRGIDRLMQIQIMKDILTLVVQSQQAIQEIDLVSLLNYIAGLAGDKTDLAQFKRPSPAAPPNAAASGGVTPPASPAPPGPAATGPASKGPGTPSNASVMQPGGQ